MVEEVLGLFISPVTTAKKRAEEKNIKKEAIIALILAVIIGLVTIITTYVSVVKAVNATYKSLKTYNKQHYKEISADEFKELKKEAKKEAIDNIEFTKTFFKTAGISLIAMAVISGVIFLIALLIKSPIDFSMALSMTNSSYIINMVGVIISLIFILFIYAPIGIILQTAVSIYAFITFVNTFRDSITISDPNKYVQISTAVISIVCVIAYFIIYHYISTALLGLFKF